MAEYETVRRAGAGVGTRADIDEGLRAHMNRVYGIMAMGMVVTGLVAFFVGSNASLINSLFTGMSRYVIMFAPLVFVFAFGAMLNRLSEFAATIAFGVFSALMGLSISYIFQVFTGISIVQTFFVTAIAFASLSLYGYTTKKDISGWGSFLIMGVVGLILASLLNIWFQSGAIAFAVNALGVLIFAGLTAYDTQKIKTTYLQMAQAGQTEWLGKAAIMGALNLYLDFINMFMFLLSFMGGRE